MKWFFSVIFHDFDIIFQISFNNLEHGMHKWSPFEPRLREYLVPIVTKIAGIYGSHPYWDCTHIWSPMQLNLIFLVKMRKIYAILWIVMIPKQTKKPVQWRASISITTKGNFKVYQRGGTIFWSGCKVFWGHRVQDHSCCIWYAQAYHIVWYICRIHKGDKMLKLKIFEKFGIQ